MHVAVLAVLAAAAACGGSGDVTGPSGNTSGHGTVTATIDGVAYSGTVSSATLSGTTGLIITSNSADETRYVHIYLQPAAVGTFTPASGTAQSVQVNVVTNSNGTVTGRWLAPLDASAGWLSIESLGTSGVSGSFAFTLVPSTTAGTPNVNKAVTNGRFKATF